MTKNYEVVGGEVTLHRDVRPLINPMTGEPRGFQLGMGRTYPEGAVVSGDAIASSYVRALEDSDHPLHEIFSAKLKPVSDDPTDNLAAFGEPFADYDEMEAENVVQAMRVLPSATIQLIKEYEAGKENRPEIVNYNIGLGEHPTARATQPEEVEQDENKAVREMTTTEVTEDGIELGEGVTGSGMPQVPPGFKKRSAGETKTPVQRRGRRARPAKPAQSEGDSE